MKRFKPDSVTIPSGIETKDFRIRILTINDSEIIFCRQDLAIRRMVGHVSGVSRATTELAGMGNSTE